MVLFKSRSLLESLASLGHRGCRTACWLLILLLAPCSLKCFLTSILRAIPAVPKSASRIFANWVFRIWVLECAYVAGGVLTCCTCRCQFAIFQLLEHLEVFVLETKVALLRSPCLACSLVTIPAGPLTGELSAPIRLLLFAGRFHRLLAP